MGTAMLFCCSGSLRKANSHGLKSFLDCRLNSYGRLCRLKSFYVKAELQHMDFLTQYFSALHWTLGCMVGCMRQLSKPTAV